jgi:hypothetical protein
LIHLGVRRVLVHFGFGRVASLEFSPAFERWVQGHFRLPVA